MSGKPTDGIISRMINRRISTRISKLIVSRGIPLTPNQATLISFIISAIPLPLYILGHPVIAGIIVQLASIIDGVDGEIARLRGLTSSFGAFMDAVLDRVADIMMLLGASIYVLKTLATPTILHFTTMFLAISGSMLVSYLHGRAEKDLGMHPVYFGKTPLIASRDVRLFILFVGSLIGYIFESLLVIAVLSLTYVFLRLIEIFKYIIAAKH